MAAHLAQGGGLALQQFLQIPRFGQVIDGALFKGGDGRFDLLLAAGWHICDMAQADTHAAPGVALREFPLTAGHGVFR